MSLRFCALADVNIDVGRVIEKLNDHMNAGSQRSTWFVCHCCNYLKQDEPSYLMPRPYCKDCVQSEVAIKQAHDELAQELADEIATVTLDAPKDANPTVIKPYTSKILQARHPEGGTKNQIDGINKTGGEGQPYSIA